MYNGKLVQLVVSEKIQRIQKMGSGSYSSGILAKLRRGVGKEPGEDPELMGYVVSRIPEDFLSKGSAPSREEWAIYLSLTLFALHQQGHDITIHCMNSDEGSFGSSLRQIAIGDANAKERIAKRLKAFGVSHDMNEAGYYLRQMIQLLRSAGVRVNYGELAKDLYVFQYTDGKQKVFLKWGQDFYKTSDKTED